MGKSSSSHRKKRAKISSQDRTRKRSKTKSRKSRSKKLRHRDDSLSYSDNDDSRSLKSVSSFSSEDDHISRRAQSRTRRDVKGSQKRARKRSYSCESREDSPRVKKRKTSKKKKDYGVRKKTRSRKKPRRDASISSTSSGSWSCSTCPSGSIIGDEIESKRHRGRPGKRKREESDIINKVKSGTRSIYRSRSHSLRSQCSKSSDCHSEGRGTGENNVRRLRSVITVTKEDDQGRWLDKDGHKEEITYDHNDYPSCRSNDSNDGGSKRELDNDLHVAFENEEALVSNVRLTKSGNIFDKDGGGQDDGINSSGDGIGITDHVNERKSEVSGAIGNLTGDDLESILRLKALENLKMFKGRHQRNAEVIANQEEKSDSDMKQSSTVKAEMVQIETPKEDGARVVVAKPSKEDVAEMLGATQLAEETIEPPVRDSTCSQIVEKEPNRSNGGNDFVAANKKVNTTTVLNKTNLAAPVSRCHLRRTHSTMKRALASQEPPQGRLLVTDGSVDKSASGTAQTVTLSSSSNVEDINNGCDSAAPEPSEDNRSDKQKDEAKEGSQFEQKTMSVMRGSEMVQVSYKVYIPKKAPALARRQLKR